MYKSLIRPILFRMSPEKAHELTFRALKYGAKSSVITNYLQKNFEQKVPRQEVEAFGLKFPNPIGLAAGLDKDAEVFDMLGYMGFGFVEIGTVTPKPQPGNPAPRLFRLPNDKALINRMGFNNSGVDAVAEKLSKRESNIIIGGNIGKNKLTPNERALDDYEICFEKLYPHVDYFVVNVSSPNTPNLRALQDREPLTNLLSQLQKLNELQVKQKPILLKIAPDLNNSQLDDIIGIVEDTQISGLIATNTTVERDHLSYTKGKIEKIGAGGLSGKPLKDRSTEVIRYISERTGGSIPIIGVGGIFDAQDVIEKIEAGAVLVQIYTSFIYSGPIIVKDLMREMIRIQAIM